MPLFFLFAAGALGASLAARRLAGEASPLPRAFWKWSLAFLVVAAASGASSILRGETLWRLLNGRPVPHYVNALSMTSAERSRDAVLLFLDMLLLVAAFDAFARVARRAALRARLLSAAAAGGALAFVTALVERAIRRQPRWDEWLALGRVGGSFTDPNALGVGVGLLVAVGLALLLSRDASPPGWGRAAAVAVLLLAFPALETSGSRSGFLLLGVAFALALAGLVRARIVPLRVVGAGLAAVLALAVAVWPVLPKGGSVSSGGLASRLAASLRAGSLTGAATHRAVFWRGAFDVIAEEPLSGCGLGGFPYEFPVRFSRRHFYINYSDNPTNALLDVAAECGVPALLLALAAAVPLLVRALDAALARDEIPAAARAAGAALVGLAAASMTGGHLRFPEVACLASLLLACLFGPGLPSAEPPADPGLVAPKRVAPTLAAAGVLASLLVVWPTRRPDAAFATEPWIGMYHPELARRTVQRWMGPLAFRRIGPGETSLSLRLANERPDDLPVTVSVEVDGAVRPGTVIPKGEVAVIDVGSLRPGQIVRFAAQPTFVPGDRFGAEDYRTLAVMNLPTAGSIFP